MCLVLALDLIRKKAQEEGHAVGPVLVLSYKNHALDEFLLDVLNQYETTIPSSYNRNFYQQRYNKLSPGMLIRTGKPDIESLSQFTERSSPLERSAQDKLSQIILVQRSARNVVKVWSDCSRSLENKSINDVRTIYTNLNN